MEAKKMFLDNPHRDEGRETWWVHNRLQKKKKKLHLSLLRVTVAEHLKTHFKSIS